MNIDVKQLKDNFFSALDDGWMLVTAGNRESFNTMTASWGSLGILWNIPVAICFVRPQRYTFQFMEKYDHYTLCFFNERHRDILRYCGSHSGRMVDKIAGTGLRPVFTERGNVYFGQARLVLECHKMYSDHIKPEMFHWPEIRERIYPAGDYHKFYIGRVVNCLKPQ